MNFWCVWLLRFTLIRVVMLGGTELSDLKSTPLGGKPHEYSSSGDLSLPVNEVPGRCLRVDGWTHPLPDWILALNRVDFQTQSKQYAEARSVDALCNDRLCLIYLFSVQRVSDIVHQINLGSGSNQGDSGVIQ